MSQKATLEEWKRLYEAVVRIEEMEPWKDFCHMDLIGLQQSSKKDMTYVSILGRRNGTRHGMIVYRGYERLNDFFVFVMRQILGISDEDVMYTQNALVCYWGNREELSQEQRKIIADLGYKYRGRNQWLYFLSYCAGCYPRNMNRDEVLAMTECMEVLAKALVYYRENNITINFEDRKMYVFSIDEENEKVSGKEAKIPNDMFRLPAVTIRNKGLIEKLGQAEKADYTLEAEITYSGLVINKEGYERPANPQMYILAEEERGKIISSEVIPLEADGNIYLLEKVIDLILARGVPKEIRVRNAMAEAALKHLCQIVGIKTKNVEELPVIDGQVKELKKSLK